MDILKNNIKLKTWYIYAAIVAAVIIFLILSSQNNSEQKSSIDFNNMPQDDVHKDLKQQPGKGNVSENVMKQLQVLKKAVDENPDDTLRLREYADYLSAAHKPDEAFYYYEKILKKDPMRIDILFAESFIFYNKQNFIKAEEITIKILGYDKKNHQAFYNLGAIAASRGDRERAKEIWSKLIIDFPNTSSSQLAKNSLNKL
jgi:tetratricopeptide (TPR) repeat protein